MTAGDDDAPRSSCLADQPAEERIRRAAQAQVEDPRLAVGDHKVQRLGERPAAAHGLGGVAGGVPARLGGDDLRLRRDPEDPDALSASGRDHTGHGGAVAVAGERPLTALDERGRLGDAAAEVGV
jgi:hypothetical protein